MNVKIVKLVTGEQLITIFEEVNDENGEGVGFKLTFPFVVVTTPLQQREGDTIKFDINYFAWMTASSDIEFIIPYSSVIAFANPAKEVYDMYVEKYEEIVNASSDTV
jgi:hypothetical protein